LAEVTSLQKAAMGQQKPLPQIMLPPGEHKRIDTAALRTYELDLYSLTLGLDFDFNCHQNMNGWSLVNSPPHHKISSKSTDNFFKLHSR